MEELMYDFETVVLDMEDGTTADYAIVEEFECDGKKYAILVEFEGDVLLDDADHSLLMKVATDDTCGEDEVILNVIESEEEYDKVVEYYNSLGEE